MRNFIGFDLIRPEFITQFFFQLLMDADAMKFSQKAFLVILHIALEFIISYPSI